MMSVSNTCFNCNVKIEDDSYGLTQCPSCQTPIFIDFDGHVQKPPDDEIVDEQEVNEPVMAEESQSAKEQEEPSDFSFDQNPQTEAPDNFSDEPKPQSDFDISQDNFFTDTPSQDITDAIGRSHFEGLEPKDDDIKSELVNKDHQRIDSDNKPLQDVIDYANSSDDVDLGDFYYNVIISGIDSKSLRESVLEALDDSRFGWKKREIDVQIKDGCLNLEKINAAKTYTLISYLKFLPVKVRWDQISLTKS